MPWSLNLIVLIGAAALPIEFYAASRISNALDVSTGWRKSRVRLATFVVVFYPILYPALSFIDFLLSGRAPIQRTGAVWDTLLMYPFWCGIVVIVQFCIIVVVLDAVSLTLRAVLKTHRERIKSVAAATTLTLAVLATIYCAYRIRRDMFGVKIAQTTLRIAGLPKDLDGLRIAQITDVHVDNRTHGEKLEHYIDTVNSYHPDLVIFCGDLISSGTSYIDQAAAALGRLKATQGVYACLGDHDYFSNPDLVANSLEKNGMVVLRDSAKILPVGDSSISLTGVTNVYARRPNPSALNALEAARPKTALDIFYTHQPSNSLIDSVAAAGYPLFLAGHTHGGQVVFPLPGFLLTGSSFETHYVTGFFKKGSTFISICNGLGMTLAPIRYQAPAEITLIDVRSEGP
ncbi:MAG TPA: metallophosphoesterase [Blastocatellia bacterium]